MRRAALRGLLARRARLALTAIAVALGVMLVSGTYVFTDTINASFDRLFSAANAASDLVVTPDVDAADTVTGNAPRLDQALVGRIGAVDGVARAEGAINDQGATLLTVSGRRLSGQAPTILGTVSPAGFGGTTYDEGRAPRTPRELAVDPATAERAGVDVGGRLALAGQEGRRTYVLTGLVSLGGSSIGGASAVLVTLAEAQRITGRGGVDRVDVALGPGARAEAVAGDVRRLAGPDARVRTGAQQAQAQSSEIEDQLSFLPTTLLAFAGIAVFVGAFLIFNTLSITVTQRAREFALLRTLGASRGQVLRAVLLEGLAIGVVGSLVGLGLGLLVAIGLKALFSLIGVDLPSQGTVIQARTIVVALAIGIVVTLVSAVVPARRATRVPPVAALREGIALPETRASRWVLPAGIVVTVLGVAAMVAGLLVNGGILALAGAGAAVTFLGVALLSPTLVGPLAALVGRPLERLTGVTGRLARENTVRQPGRTAVTAAALMIGVALVAFATIFTAGVRATIDGAIDGGIRGQLIVQGADGFSPFPQQALKAIADVDGVGTVSGVLTADNVSVAGQDAGLTAIDPQTFGRVYDLDVSGLGPRTAIVAQDFATAHDLRAGSPLAIRAPNGGPRLALRVARVQDISALVLGDVLVDQRLVRRAFGVRQASYAFAAYRPGADSARTQAGVERVLRTRYPQVEALTLAAYKDEQGGQVTQLLGLIYALLALSILVSLFGIVNTLVLSVTERTRELGMLRAIGTSRRQVRRIVRYEAVITALIGGIIGLVVGIALAALVGTTLDGFTLTVPVASLLVLLVLAGLAGSAAAVLPARRAARLDVLEALAHE